MFHLISFSPHFIVHELSLPSVDTSLLMFHCYFLQSTVHLIHLAYHSPSRSYLPYLVIYHITCSLNHIVSFAFQPNLSPGISGLRVFLKVVLILDRYSLLEAELRWFYYSLSLCVGQEKQRWKVAWVFFLKYRRWCFVPWCFRMGWGGGGVFCRGICCWDWWGWGPGCLVSVPCQDCQGFVLNSASYLGFSVTCDATYLHQVCK